MENRRADFLIEAYRAHKAEMAVRRRTEIVTAAAVIIFYSSCIGLVCLNDAAARLLSGLSARAIGTILLILIANVTCYFQYKNYKRHCELHRTIADIDRAFGFFEKNAYLPERSLYPEDWQYSGRFREASMYGRYMITMVFALMAVVAIWAGSAI